MTKTEREQMRSDLLAMRREMRAHEKDQDPSGKHWFRMCDLLAASIRVLGAK